MWVSTSVAHPGTGPKSRNSHVWLYCSDRGAFVGYFVVFDVDGPVEDGEYGDGHGPCEPTHFWDGDGEPDGDPRL
jgi:hypothetical protein